MAVVEGKCADLGSYGKPSLSSSSLPYLSSLLQNIFLPKFHEENKIIWTYTSNGDISFKDAITCSLS